MAGRPRAALALILLFVVSLALRIYPVLALHFDGLYGQDPFAYYSYGQQLRATVAHAQPLGLFYWPLGYPVLVALSFVFTGEQPLGPQIVSLIAGALVSVLAYLIAVEVARHLGKPARFARLAGLVAWVVTAVCGQLIQSSMVIMADASALMWASLSTWSLLVYGRSRHSGWIALSAFALAWATMTRWQYGTLALPWVLYVLLNRPFIIHHAALAVIVGLITLSPQIAYTIQHPYPFIGHEWLQGWSVSNAFARDFVTADGTFHYDQSPAQYYAQPFTYVYYMSPLLLPLLIIGLILLARQTAFIVLFGWFVVQYGFLAGIPYENIRFALALFPPTAVCVGLGTAWVIVDLKISTWSRILTISAVSLVIIYGSLATLRSSAPIINSFVTAKDADLASARWVEQQIPEQNATVYCLDLLLTMEHYTLLHPVQIYQMTTDTLRDQLQHTHPAYAVFNLSTTEHQWYGQSPWIIYHWLLDNPGMTQIGMFGNYTLYRINQ
jgi:hypothetical protein